ncbi:MAG: UDP-N-acetylmuramoyl-L-alanyl-D-glutamate--2,6-diaminopimelate ligase [Bacteroidales bacterium]
MKKQLVQIIHNISTISIVGETHIDIDDIHTNSRNIQDNMLFIAYKGVSVDGHSFIEQAIKQGASAVVCEKLPSTTHPHVCYIQVKNSIEACGKILTNWYDINFSKLQVIGITGTNGKTTSVSLLHKVFSQLGYTCGLLSTVRNVIGTKEIPATHTTPDIIQLYALLHHMQQAGCSHCFMEVSSHALHQNRISGIQFSGALFSNITQDHLDYHKTFAAYIHAKKVFFDNLNSSAFALTNNDDKNGMTMVQNTLGEIYTYSLKSYSDFKCKIMEMHTDGMLLQIDGTEVWTKFIGSFNAYNITAVYATAKIMGESHEKILQAISSLSPADGRLEFFKSTDGKTAIVDYAHTPDALENILRTLKQQCKGETELITVVGAGGDRDKTKRPLMGKIASSYSNRVIITADNPRSEEPQDIANNMLEGIDEHARASVLCILDRKEAIKTAILLAKKGDLIVVAGKGHETYQEVKGVTNHFDDREIIKEIFKL